MGLSLRTMPERIITLNARDKDRKTGDSPTPFFLVSWKEAGPRTALENLCKIKRFANNSGMTGTQLEQALGIFIERVLKEQKRQS